VDFASTIQAVARSGWTAPEVLRSPANGLAASNVYSFGVIVWQLLTRSALPFGMPFNEQLARRVQAGLRPDIPAGVVPAFAELMARCWHAEPSK
jgi:serine/threonine protein kinase